MIAIETARQRLPSPAETAELNEALEAAIGELSLTADRQYLYFVFATPGFADLGIAVARHR